MDALPLLAPAFLVFEVWQLVIGERYLGIKQIARGADPRRLGLSEATAFLWTLTLFAYWAWMLLILFSPASRVHAVSLIAVTTVGFMLRRGLPLRWVLVEMSIEGAIRIGLLVALCGVLWWHRR